MKNIFLNKQRKFSIRKLTVGTISVAVGLVFINDVTGISRVEAALSVEDSNYINQTAPDNGALVEYIRQALATISKAANSTVLPSSIQNLKDKVQALSTKKEADYTETAWQAFQGKLTTAKTVLVEAEKAYNNAVRLNVNAQSYEATINELTTSYPEYNTVVIKVRDGETTEDAENRHLTNIRRINGVLTTKYSELSETANSIKKVLPPVGGDLAAQQLEIIKLAENVLEVNKKIPTVAVENHADLVAGLFENNKVVLSEASNLRGHITTEDQNKITAFLENHSPSMGETAVFQTFTGALQYKFNNDGTVTITYTDDGSSDTVPLSIFAKGGSTQTDSPAATYNVTYNYVSGTPDKTLPSSITVPAAVNDKHTGDVVASPTGQTDVEDAANQGTWHFNGWDKASVTIGTANEVVTGTWNFVPTPPVATYTVTYNYVSGTPDKNLPSSITAPAVVSDKHTGDVVASPTGQTDVEDTANQGTWHFNGWDKPSVTIGAANETVTGTWTFTATPGENPSTTPGTATPEENPSTTPGTAISGENPSTTPGTATPGENPSTTPGTTTPGENPSTTPGTTTPGENPSTTPGTATPGENPSTTPETTTPGENPSTTPGTTTPGTETPGGNPEMPNPPVHELSEFNGGVPGIPEVHDKPQFNGGVPTPGTSKTSNPRGTTPRTTYLFVTSKEDKTLPNSVVEGWSKKDGQWLYQLENGSHIVNEWKQINGTWYHFDNSGVMQTGWIKENGTWYYLNKSGAMQTGWVKENGTWYYLNDSGAMQTGWVKENGTWYYLNQSGSMETGWFTVSDKWYYANESGALAINTTTPDGYTVNADGEWVE